jgi:NADH-quinone oxidoreductase subunit F
VKWGFIPPTNTKPVYLICNADESEPGTFKDRYIMHQDPHQLIEGMTIACFAVNGAKLGLHLHPRGIPAGAIIVEKAIAEAHAKGFLGKNIQGSGFDCEILRPSRRGCLHLRRRDRPHRVPGRQAPLSAHQAALFPCRARPLHEPDHRQQRRVPLPCEAHPQMGGAEYAKLGTPNNTGTRILCVSGDVQKPGYYEVEVGKVTMGEVIDDLCGGLKPGRKLKAIIPGGSSAKVLRADEKFKLKDGRELTIMDIPMDFDTMAAVRHHGRLRRRHHHGRQPQHELGHQQPEQLLRPRELRPVHPVPRRQPVDEKDQRPHRLRQRQPRRRGHPGAPSPIRSKARPSAPSAKPASWPTQSFIKKFRDELKADCKADLAGRVVNGETTVAAAGLSA